MSRTGGWPDLDRAWSGSWLGDPLKPGVAAPDNGLAKPYQQPAQPDDDQQCQRFITYVFIKQLTSPIKRFVCQL